MLCVYHSDLGTINNHSIKLFSEIPSDFNKNYGNNDVHDRSENRKSWTIGCTSGWLFWFYSKCKSRAPEKYTVLQP